MMLRYDPVYQDIVNKCTGRLEITYMMDGDRFGVGDFWHFVPGQKRIEAKWIGGPVVAFSGELLRDLDYTHPQIQFEPPLLHIAGYILRWIEWWEEYDLAVFERVTIYGNPVIPYSA